MTDIESLRRDILAIEKRLSALETSAPPTLRWKDVAVSSDGGKTWGVGARPDVSPEKWVSTYTTCRIHPLGWWWAQRPNGETVPIKIETHDHWREFDRNGYTILAPCPMPGES